MRRRRMIRRALRRRLHRGQRPLGRPGLRIIPLGMFVLYVFEETGAKVKLHRDDIKRIVESKGKPIREMNEEELLAAMEELGIENRQMTADDQNVTSTVEKKQTTMDDLKVLEELALMLYKGFITDEEYEEKKKDVLGLD
jgi:hypothetical protein